MKNMKRRRILQGMAAGAASGLTGLIREALSAGSSPPRQGINILKGEVTVNGVPASVGDPINRGDTVKTGPGAHVVYVLGEDAYMQRANSTVIFGDVTATFLRVVTGGLLSVFGKGSRRLATTTATIGIRGTGCYIETDSAKTYFCLCFGAADLQPEGGAAVSYATTHHERPLWIENGAAMPATVVNHTDAEIIMLEALVGRGSPFPSGGIKY